MNTLVLGQTWQKICIEDDANAFDFLCRSYFAPLVEFSNSYTNNVEESERVAVYVFSQLWKNRKLIARIPDPKFYIFRVTRERLAA